MLDRTIDGTRNGHFVLMMLNVPEKSEFEVLCSFVEMIVFEVRKYGLNIGVRNEQMQITHSRSSELKCGERSILTADVAS